MITEFKTTLKNSKFIELWFSQIFSQLTINIMNFLLLSKLYMVTKSSIATSLLWLAYSLPALFLGPIGAASVDLISRRKTLMFTNLLQAIIVTSFLFLDQQNVFIIYFIVLLYSILNQFYGPAESAYLPSTVDKASLSSANSLFFITLQSTLVLGFGFAGLIQKFFGFNGAVMICGVMMFLAFVSTTLLDEIKPNKNIPKNIEEIFKTFLNSIIEGYEFIKSHHLILFPLLLLLSIQGGLAILVVSLPIIASQILNIAVTYSGISIVVPAGIGAIIGSVYIPRLIKRKVRKIKIIKFSLGLVCFALLSLSLGIPFLSVALRVAITPILIVGAGLGFVGINLPTVTFLQEATPLWFRGRVFGNLWFLVTIVTIFPVLFSGAITEIFGIRTMLTIIGLGTLSIFVYLRNAKRLFTNYRT